MSQYQELLESVFRNLFGENFQGLKGSGKWQEVGSLNGIGFCRYFVMNF